MPQSQQEFDLSHEQAFNTLVENVHMPVFFSKLAQEYGVVPQNENEAQQLVELSHRLRAAHGQELDKSAGQAAQPNEFLSAANELLGGAPAQSAAAIPVEKYAAAELAQNPLIREASLTHQDNVAANILAQQLQQK
jgi:hypothetical protein